MLAIYVDLKKAFDSVHREALWDLLRLCGISALIISLLPGLCSGTESAVKCGGRHVQLLSCAYESEAGMHPCSITFQYMYKLGTVRVVDQSHCGASVSQHQDH